MAYDFNSLTKQAAEATNRDGFYTDFEDVDPSKLHQITELTEWLRTKGKGSDVREVIAQLFERTWVESIKEGNANMEVAQARGAHPNLRSRLDEADNKQHQTTTALDVERARIDSFTALTKGSTTGDAELIDGRIGSLGFVYPTIGAGIREQIKNVISSGISSSSFTMESNFTGKLITINHEFYVGQTVELSISGADGIYKRDVLCNVAIIKPDGTQSNQVADIYYNKPLSYTIQQNCKGIVVWVPSDGKLANGTITFSVNHPKNIYSQIKDIDRIIQLAFDSKYEDAIFIEKSISVVPSKVVEKAIPINFGSGQKVYVEVQTNGEIDRNATIYMGVTYPDGEHTNQLLLQPNVVEEYTFTDVSSRLRFWISGLDVISDGTIKFVIRNIPTLIEDISDLNTQIENIKNSSGGKTFSILGDSYSTYSDWLPNGYPSWYHGTENGVTSAKDTWWWKLSNETKLSLLTNSSYSGSTVCNTGYSGSDSTATSFITRMKADIGNAKATAVKPDIIFIFGGTNDYWAKVPLGVAQYSNWSETDLKQFLPAFCYMLDYLKTWNPHARIINITNTDLGSDVKNGMASACTYYNVENVVLKNIAKEAGHPTVAGMASIKDQIKSIL